MLLDIDKTAYKTRRSTLVAGGKKIRLAGVALRQ